MMGRCYLGKTKLDDIHARGVCNSHCARIPEFEGQTWKSLHPTKQSTWRYNGMMLDVMNNEYLSNLGHYKLLFCWNFIWLHKLNTNILQAWLVPRAGVSIFQQNCKTTGVHLVIIANCLVHRCHQIAYFKKNKNVHVPKMQHNTSMIL